MRPLTFHKNLPATIDKKSSQHVSKPLPQLHSNSSFLSFSSSKELLINTDALPIQLFIQDSQWNQLSIIISATIITVKYKQQSCNSAILATHKKWLRLVFGHQFGKVEIRARFNENKLNKKNISNSFSQWNQQHEKESLDYITQNLQPLFDTLKAKTEATPKETENHRPIGKILRAKLSERANSFCHKPPLIGKKDQFSLQCGISKEIFKNEGETAKFKKSDAKTINFNNYFENREKISKRQANTSNSHRNQIAQSKIIKMHKKLTEMSLTKHIDSTILPEIPKQKQIDQRKKPRFYQQIPALSVEEIDLKRGKFDSQFILKQDLDFRMKGNQSQVTEDIVKLENSRLGHLEDTFEQGLQHKGLVNKMVAAEQSGTLCQSVFQ